ncbi:MAG: isovaleryl-CoA dehydrogenase, partial [Candidatus Dadabacteria bacterium]
MAKVFPDELFPDEEHTLLAHTLRQFVKDKVEPQAQEFNEKENFNKKLFKELAPLGLLGITAPVQYGGSEMDATSVVITHEELSYSDPGFCLAYLAHSILCVNNIATNGSPAQKEKFLPKLCSGEAIGAMALSEPGCGTDVLAMQTTAEKKDNTYILNGRKMWITNGTVDEGETPCDVVVVYARSNITGSAPPEKISTFIVTKNTPGFSVGQKITGKLGMRSSNTAELCFDNCCIPAENLMGKEGESLFHMMRNLEIERLSLAAMGLGIARRCLDTM